MYCYYRAMPLPMASYRLEQSEEGEDSLLHGSSERSSNQFVSSVCWSRNNRVLLAGNSTGDVKVLALA